MALNIYNEYYRNYYTSLQDSQGGKGRRERRKAEIDAADLNVAQAKNDLWVSPKITDGLADTFAEFHEDLAAAATHVIEGDVAGDGFLTGTGYAHQTWLIGDDKPNDVQIGLEFDPTTGVPFLKGSGLKGGLRAWMDVQTKDAEIKKQRNALCNLLATSALQAPHVACPEWKAHLFQGGRAYKTKERTYSQQTPVFLGMAPTMPAKNVPLFQLRHLAPQKTATSKPIPLPFLSLNPGTKMRAYFTFPPPRMGDAHADEEYSRDVQATLTMFAYFMSHYGLGAKKRYGYGKLKDVKLEALRLGKQYWFDGWHFMDQKSN